MKPNSETYARIFFDISIALLILGLIGLLMSLMFYPIFLIILPFFLFGIVLLSGYYKLKNKNLTMKWNIRLWFGTVFFNGILFLLTFGFTFENTLQGNWYKNRELQIYAVLISFGYFVLTSSGIFALSAARAERNEKQSELAFKSQTFT